MIAHNDKNQRHCVAKRVSMMIAFIKNETVLQEVVSVGCRCADQKICDLWEACKRIHQSFHSPKS
jgi:flagellar biosynthesis regulator FlbT